MKKTLVTGATGAIGMYLLKHWKERGDLKDVSIFVRDSKKNRKSLEPYANDLTIYYGDIRNEEDLTPAIQDHEVIIHMAAIIPPLYHDQEEMGWSVNVGGTKAVLNVMKSTESKATLVYTSSVATYGDRLKTPNIFVTDKLDAGIDGYGKSKIESEKLIQESGVNWTILRLAAIMGIGNHKIDKIMFHVPMDTVMEIATVSDTSRALANTPEHIDELEGQIFNLGGGESCTSTYHEFMVRFFKCFGLGKVRFAKNAFATYNFHCGYYADGDDLEQILHFRKDTLDSYFDRLHKSINPLQRGLTRPLAWFVKRYLESLSEPLKAYKKNDKEQIARFFDKLEA